MKYIVILFVVLLVPFSQTFAATACIQVIQPAKNITTGECKNFPTPCDVPSGWNAVSECMPATETQVNFSLKKFNSCDELKSTLFDILSAYQSRYWGPYPLSTR